MKRLSAIMTGFLLFGAAAVPAYGMDVGGKSFGPDDALAIADSERSEGSIQSNEFGTGGDVILNIGPCDLVPRDAADSSAIDHPDCESAGVLSGQSVVRLGAEVRLPNGVQITEVTIFYGDTIPDSNPSAGLWRVNTAGVGAGVQFLDPAEVFSGGDTSFTATLATAHTVDNTANKYNFLVVLDRSPVTPSQEERIFRVAIKYRRQVSPAPGTATFADVSAGHVFFRFVEALATSGITAGCGAGNYCPDAPLTRGQMAVFLSEALGLHWPN